MKHRNYILVLLFLINIPCYLSCMDHGRNLENAGRSLQAAWQLAQHLSSPKSAALALVAFAAAGAGTARWWWPTRTPVLQPDEPQIREKKNKEENAVGDPSDNRLALVPVHEPDGQEIPEHLLPRSRDTIRLTPRQQMFLAQLILAQQQLQRQSDRHPLLLLAAPPTRDQPTFEAGEPAGNVGTPAFAAPATARDWQRARLTWQAHAPQHAAITTEDQLAQQAFWQQLQAQHRQPDHHPLLALTAPPAHTGLQYHGEEDNVAEGVDEREQVGTEIADLHRRGKLLQKSFDQWLETTALQSEQRRLAQQERAHGRAVLQYFKDLAEYRRRMQARKRDPIECYLAPQPRHHRFRGKGTPPELNKDGKKILHGAYDLYSSNVGSKNPAFTLRKLLRQDPALHRDFLALNEASSTRALCTINIYTHGHTTRPCPPKHEPYQLDRVLEHLLHKPRYHTARS